MSDLLLAIAAACNRIPATKAPAIIVYPKDAPRYRLPVRWLKQWPPRTPNDAHPDSR